MSQFRAMTAALALVLWVCAPTRAPAADQAAEMQTVLFVCEHGLVKSLLAKLLFERAAAREGLALSAASRATAADAEVPDWMRTALERDGFHIGHWRPAALSEADVRSARIVVTFDVSLPFEGEHGPQPRGLPRLPPARPDGAAALRR